MTIEKDPQQFFSSTQLLLIQKIYQENEADILNQYGLLLPILEELGVQRDKRTFVLEAMRGLLQNRRQQKKPGYSAFEPSIDQQPGEAAAKIAVVWSDPTLNGIETVVTMSMPTVKFLQRWYAQKLTKCTAGKRDPIDICGFFQKIHGNNNWRHAIVFYLALLSAYDMFRNLRREVDDKTIKININVHIPMHLLVKLGRKFVEAKIDEPELSFTKLIERALANASNILRRNPDIGNAPGLSELLIG